MDWLKDRTLGDQSKLEKVKQLSDIAAGLNIPLNRLAIAWTLKNSNVSTVLLGASKVEQLRDNLKSPEVLPLLTPEIIKNIESILCNQPVPVPY